MFKSLQLSKSDAGFLAAITDTDESQLPAGDVLVKVDYSTLNYKDGLAITNKNPGLMGVRFHAKSQTTD